MNKTTKPLGVEIFQNFDHITSSKQISYNVQKVEFNQLLPAYFMKKTSHEQGLNSIASSKMYKSIGINTPQVFLVNDKNKNFSTTIQKDVTTFNEFVTTLAQSDYDFCQFEKKAYSKYKWQMFYDKTLIIEFLKFMTPDCLEQLQNVFLVDEIRTDMDRHTQNYFFYKSPLSKKYEGIIVIDLEQMIVYNYCGTSKDEFMQFLYFPYTSVTPQQSIDEMNYLQRVKNIRELIQDGVLSPNNIQTLKDALRYNYPKELKSVCKEKALSRKERNQIITPIQRLWEYNNQTIGKELGL